MNAYCDYLEHGWALIPIKNGTKQPYLKDWTRPENAIRGSQNADKLNGSAGLLLAHCDPPLMTLDIDDFHATADYLDKRGIDLAALILADDAVQIDSGRPNRAKLVYRLDRPRPTHKEIQDGTALFELRCADRNGGSVQDVLPPSIHPDTRKPYTWKGKGHWRRISPIPEALLELWESLETIPGNNEEMGSLAKRLGTSCKDKPPNGLTAEADVPIILNALNQIDPSCGYED